MKTRERYKNVGTKSKKTGLNRKQIKIAEMLSNPEFSGTITQLCQEVGIARSTFYDWLDKDEFREYLDNLIDKYTDSELSRVWKVLIRKIEEGDLTAIKLYFELKGKYKQGVGVKINDQEESRGVIIIPAVKEDAENE